MQKLKLQYFNHLMQRTDSLEKTLIWERLKAGGEGDNKEWDGWKASLTQWSRVWASSRSWWWTGKPDVLQFIGSHRVGHDWATELNWDTQEVASSLWPQSRQRWSFSKLSVWAFLFHPEGDCLVYMPLILLPASFLGYMVQRGPRASYFPHPPSHVFKVKDHCCRF